MHKAFFTRVFKVVPGTKCRCGGGGRDDSCILEAFVWIHGYAGNLDYVDYAQRRD